MTYLADFPGCCGASILHNFYNEKDTRKTFSRGHLYIAILNDGQVDKHGPVLESRGFRLVSKEVTNYNTGNVLYLYIRDGKKERVKQVKKRMFA